MAQKFVTANNFATTLSAAITDSQTTVSVASATGLDAPDSPDYHLIRLTIFDDTNIEIITVSAISGTSLTVARGAEGTTARAWDSGAKVEARLTAGMLQSFVGGLDTTGDAVPFSSIDIQSDRSASSQVASGSQSVAIGYRCTAAGSGNVAIGHQAHTEGVGSVFVGYGGHGDIPARTGQSSPNQTVGVGTAEKPLAFHGAAHYSGLDFVQLDEGEYAGASADQGYSRLLSTREMTFFSPPIQMGDAGWPGATTTVKHGRTIRVSGRSYVAWCMPDYYGEETTGATEPTWPTTPGDWIADGGVWWIHVSDTFTFQAPFFSRFTPTKIGVIAHWSTPGGSVVYPQITAGPSGAATAWLAATTINKITGHLSNQFEDPATTEGAQDFIAALSTAGSDLDCSARLVIKGYVLEFGDS